MLTGEEEWCHARIGCGPLEATPGELVVLVLAALGWNAFIYGALLLLSGVTASWVFALVLGGGTVGLASSSWLAVVYHVREVIWDAD